MISKIMISLISCAISMQMVASEPMTYKNKFATENREQLLKQKAKPQVGAFNASQKLTSNRKQGSMHEFDEELNEKVLVMPESPK